MCKGTKTVIEASTCPVCHKADFRRVQCSCGMVMTDYGSCNGGHEPTKTEGT